MKNPWMSMWLSGANKVAGTARGLLMGEMRRQQSKAVKDAGKAVGQALSPPKVAKKKRRPKPRKRSF